MSVPEAAAILGVSKRTVWRMIHDGELPAVHVGGRTLVRVDHLTAWIESHTREGDR